MPKIVLILLGIQYILGIAFKTTTAFTFGILDLIIHILFGVQTVCMLFLIYMYINGANAQNLNEKTRSLVNTIVNFVILLSVLIFSMNLVNVFLIDSLSNIF